MDVFAGNTSSLRLIVYRRRLMQDAEKAQFVRLNTLLHELKLSAIEISN
jgi:hypothetical protein